MQRKALKNFVYSFLFSLSVTAIIGKVCFSYPENKNPKNNSETPENLDISLFSKPTDVLKISQTPDIDVSAIDALAPIKEENTETKVATADGTSLAPVPDIELARAEKSTDTADTSVKTDLAYASEIVLEDEKPLQLAKTSKPDYEKSGIVYADISDTVKDEQLQFSSVVYQGSQQFSSISHPQSENADNLSSKTTVEDDENSVTVNIAQNSILPEVSEDENIPLSENFETLHASIEVSNSAENSEIAMLEPTHLVSSIEELDEEPEKTLAEADLKQDDWKQMSDTKQDNPWIVAKGNKFAKNKIVVEQFSETSNSTDEPSTSANNENQQISETIRPEKITRNKDEETELAYQMVPNLLIPIPEDIANDPDLTPQLSVTPQGKKGAEVKTEANDNTPKNEASLSEKEKDSGLFKNITSWFAGSDKENSENNDTKKDNNKKGFNFFGRGNQSTEISSNKSQILPAELRLSFQPNKAEISGQTLRWIHAFADNALNNNDIYIEVRIDGTSSFALQKKRLNLLSTIFANRGVDFRKINIVFTSREPNSFIIRNIRFNNNEEVVVNKRSGNSYYQPW